ncbi:MAG: HupE/UreJ family protein [Verrucomicrobiota bacterium]
MKTPLLGKNSSSTAFKFLLAALFFALFPNFASAHILPDGMRHGFNDGFAHPFLGIDHLLAMFAVGVWAMQQKGNARWLIPLSFVGVMTLGGNVGLMNFHVPLAEFFIATSLLVLGILITTSARLLPVLSIMLVGVRPMISS